MEFLWKTWYTDSIHPLIAKCFIILLHLFLFIKPAFPSYLDCIKLHSFTLIRTTGGYLHPDPEDKKAKITIINFKFMKQTFKFLSSIIWKYRVRQLSTQQFSLKFRLCHKYVLPTPWFDWIRMETKMQILNSDHRYRYRYRYLPVYNVLYADPNF